MCRSLPVVMLLLLFVPVLQAQSTSAGASYTLLSLTYPDQIPNGVGGWLTWDVASRGPTVGLDLGASFFPEDHPLIGRQTELVAGVRAGLRAGGYGAFARVRPGLLHFSERFFAPEIVCILIFPPPESCLIEATNAIVDLGGTVELYPTLRTLIRVDLGDTLIRFSRTGQEAIWKHNLQFSAGAGVRF